MSRVRVSLAAPILVVMLKEVLYVKVVSVSFIGVFMLMRIASLAALIILILVKLS